MSELHSAESDKRSPSSSSTTGRLPCSAAQHSPFHLEGWIVYPALNRIEREQIGGRDDGAAEGPEQLEPRIMHVLACLVARPGEVLSRADLMDTVWGDVVVGDEVLTRAISRLRIILGDRADQPRLIETIRGGGTV